MRLSLKTRITLTTSLLVLAVVGTVIAIVAWIVRGQVSEAAKSAAGRASILLEHSIADQLERLSIEAQLIVDLPTTKSISGAPDAATVEQYLETCRKQVGVDWVMWTDSDGFVFAQTSEARFEPGSEPSAVRSAVEGKAWSGTLFRGSRVEFVTCQPVTIGQYVKGTMSFGKVLDEAMLGRIADAAQLEIAVVSGESVVVSTVPITTVPSRDGAQELNVEGKRFIGQFIGVPNSELRLLALTPEAKVTAPFAPLRYSLFALLVVALAAAIAIGASLALQLTSPLDALMRAASELQAGRWPEPFRPTRKDEIGFLQGHFDEMTESLRRSRERLVAMLDVDPLTELPNHRSFKQRLQAAIESNPNELAVVLLDLDNFEGFNQRHGAERGDEALVAVSQIVRQVAGEDGLCGRHGGNVFGIAVRAREPLAVAELLRQRVSSETEVTVSVGVCRFGESTQKVDVILLAAEMAVGQAKSAGRNRSREFVGFDMEADEDGLRRLLRGGSYAAVRALAEAVDAKDRYTRGHSQRVAEYAKALAEASGFDEGFVELVYVSGTLHDVGKIGVPDEVLKKTSRLTDEEFAQVKLHPELGEKIVMQIPELRETLPGVRSHHERYDGRGYPDKLVGNEIPLIARILSIADAFDAMTSDRSYREGMSFEHAIMQIREGSGSQFDPDLAATFVAMMESDRQVA